jgi:hypothetical protein
MFRRIKGHGDFLAVIPTVILKICHLCKIAEFAGVLECFS